jgi:hypothetical protein
MQGSSTSLVLADGEGGNRETREEAVRSGAGVACPPDEHTRQPETTTPKTHEPALAVVAEVYAALVLLSLVGYSLNRALLELEQRLMPWYTRSA